MYQCIAIVSLRFFHDKCALQHRRVIEGKFNLGDNYLILGLTRLPCNRVIVQTLKSITVALVLTLSYTQSPTTQSGRHANNPLREYMLQNFPIAASGEEIRNNNLKRSCITSKEITNDGLFILACLFILSVLN